MPVARRLHNAAEVAEAIARDSFHPDAAESIEAAAAALREDYWDLRDAEPLNVLDHVEYRHYIAGSDGLPDFTRASRLNWNIAGGYLTMTPNVRYGRVGAPVVRLTDAGILRLNALELIFNGNIYGDPDPRFVALAVEEDEDR